MDNHLFILLLREKILFKSNKKTKLHIKINLKT